MNLNNIKMKARIFLFAILIIPFLSQCATREAGIIMTVNGPIISSEMGVTLVHEHILVDFIGADSTNINRWNRPEVIKRSLPFLKQIRDLSCESFIECTPDYLGRDPQLLKELSDLSGLHILTNTGYYGAMNNKFLPEQAFDQTADQLADIWTGEWENGIDGTGIKPGFIKIGVSREKLSEMHRKIVTAAARTHLRTGLTIAAHTGPAITAFEELEVLRNEGVSPEAFIWVHSQNETDPGKRVEAAKMGAWISLDGINDTNIEEYVQMITQMKENNLLNKVLLSHDAGWYSPGEENGGEYRGYNTLFEKLIPALREKNFLEKDINQLIVNNPAEAYAIGVRKIQN